MAMVNIVTAKITVDHAKAKIADPGHTIPGAKSGTGNPAFIGNLTHNFNENDKLCGHAFTATGEVEVSAAPGELNTWDFGFIQFQRLNAFTLMYGGMTADEGGIIVNAEKAMTPLVCLDSKAAGTDSTGKPTGHPPWTNAKTKGTLTFDAAAGKAKIETGDHPQHRVGTMLINKRTARDNFLFKLIDDRDYWTVFVARNPAGLMQHLAHFHWKLKYVYTFKWRKGEPKGAKDPTSVLTFDKPQPGPPTEPAIQGLLKNPAAPMANPVMMNGLQKAVEESSQHRIDTSVNERFGVFPKDFWS
jgi:hypothetical protein